MLNKFKEKIIPVIIMPPFLLFISFLIIVLIYIIKWAIMAVIVIILLVACLLKIVFQFLQEKAKHKNETPEQRAERLKTEEMIEEWQKRYY